MEQPSKSISVKTNIAIRIITKFPGKPNEKVQRPAQPVRCNALLGIRALSWFSRNDEARPKCELRPKGTDHLFGHFQLSNTPVAKNCDKEDALATIVFGQPEGLNVRWAQ